MARALFVWWLVEPKFEVIFSCMHAVCETDAPLVGHFLRESSRLTDVVQPLNALFLGKDEQGQVSVVRTLLRLYQEGED